MSRSPLGACSCSSTPIGGLGASLFTKLIRSATPGPNAFKLQSTPKELKKVIAVAGPALNAIPGWGTVAAAGAAVITAADQRAKAQKVASANAGAQLMQEYSGIAGTVPGRAFGIPAMEKVIASIGQAGGWPNVKKWGDAIVDQVIMTGCKGCTPPTMIDWIKQKVSSGQNNPLSLVNEWTNLVNQTWGSKWLVASAGDLQRQALIDTLDALIAQVDPNAPLYYAQPSADPGTAPTPTPSPSPIPSPTPSTPIPGVPGATFPLPVQTLPAPSSVTDPALSAYVQALMAQGQSQQQAFNSALQALQNAGVQPTPQVQQTVADTVKNNAPSQAGVYSLAIGAVAVIGIGIVLSNRRKRR